MQVGSFRKCDVANAEVKSEPGFRSSYSGWSWRWSEKLQVQVLLFVVVFPCISFTLMTHFPLLPLVHLAKSKNEKNKMTSVFIRRSQRGKSRSSHSKRFFILITLSAFHLELDFSGCMLVRGLTGSRAGRVKERQANELLILLWLRFLNDYFSFCPQRSLTLITEFCRSTIKMDIFHMNDYVFLWF